MLRTLWYGVGQLYSIGMGYESGGVTMMATALAMYALRRLARASIETVAGAS
jgi:hypothetical protein